MRACAPREVQARSNANNCHRSLNRDRAATNRFPVCRLLRAGRVNIAGPASTVGAADPHRDRHPHGPDARLSRRGAASGPLLDAPEAAPTQEELDDPVPVIALMNRQRAGQVLDPVEVFEALEPLDTAIIGDVESCRAKLEKFAALGVDRLMCLMDFGALPHERVMESIRLVGKQLIPSLARQGRDPWKAPA